MLNLITDIHIMVNNDSCQNRVSADHCHMTVSRAQVPTHPGHVFFFKFSANQLLAFNFSRVQVYFFQSVFAMV